MTDTQKTSATEDIATTLPNVTQISVYQKQSPMKIVLGSLGIGGATGGLASLFAGDINVQMQGADPSLKGLKRFFNSTRETFEFSTKSYDKWVYTALFSGFAAGAIATAIGAIHHNREFAKAVSTPAPDEITR